MDVPEAGKHGKKSTSQKLEDQKKVGKLFFFFLFDFCYLEIWPTLAFIDVHLYSHGSSGMLRCCSPELLPF